MTVKTNLSLEQKLLAAQQRAQQAEVALAQTKASLQNSINYHLRQQKLLQVANTLLSSQYIEEVWLHLTESTQELLAVDRIAVYIVSQQKISCPYASGLSSTYIEQSLSNFYETITTFTFATQTHLIIDNAQQTEHNSLLPQLASSEGFHTYALFSLIVSEEVIGGLALFRDKLRPFSIEDQSIGQSLAQFTATALTNAKRYSKQVHATLQEKKINQMARTLNRTQNLPAILSRLIRMAAEIVQADAGSLGLVIDNNTIIFYPHNMPKNFNTVPSPKGAGVAWQIVETSQSYLLNNYQEHEKAKTEWSSNNVQPFIGVPILAGSDECIGAIGLFRFTRTKPFSQQDLRLAESFGLQAGNAIQETRLYAESKSRNESLANALARLEKRDEARTEFLENVSHEFRTPLGLIFGHAELLESGLLGPLDDTQLNSVQVIARRARMLSKFTDDLMALMTAEAQEFRRELINTNYFFQSLLFEFQTKSEDTGVTLDSIIAPNLPKLLGDPVHLARVFDNLLGNAFKFTPSGGTITLEVKAKNEGVVIHIHDTGIGISQEKLPYIFDRFYQADRYVKDNYGGVGLGLALAKEILEGHNGWIDVNSNEGIGTTFHITLPAYESDTTTEPQPQNSILEAP